MNNSNHKEKVTGGNRQMKTKVKMPLRLSISPDERVDNSFEEEFFRCQMLAQKFLPVSDPFIIRARGILALVFLYRYGKKIWFMSDQTIINELLKINDFHKLLADIKLDVRNEKSINLINHYLGSKNALFQYVIEDMKEELLRHNTNVEAIPT